MEKHFAFGHTMEPIEVEDDSSSNLENLFKIGQAPIKMGEKHKSPELIEISDSDETPVLNQKEKKVVKEKHKKKHKDHPHD